MATPETTRQQGCIVESFNDFVDRTGMDGSSIAAREAYTGELSANHDIVTLAASGFRKVMHNDSAGSYHLGPILPVQRSEEVV